MARHSVSSVSNHWQVGQSLQNLCKHLRMAVTAFHALFSILWTFHPMPRSAVMAELNWSRGFQATHPHHCTGRGHDSNLWSVHFVSRNRQSHNNVCGPRPVCTALTLSEMACVSSVAYTGLHVDIDRIRADNEANKTALRKSGLIIWEGRKLWPYI